MQATLHLSTTWSFDSPLLAHLCCQWNDLGYKNRMIRSPNLDRLATEGVQLTSHCASRLLPSLLPAPPPLLTAADTRHRPCAGLYTPAFGVGADAFKVCSPSRSSFHTGRYPFTLGLYDNSPRAVPHLRPQITNGLDPDISVRRAVPSGYKLLPELLAAKGYRRHAVGKWHLGMALRKCASRLSLTEAAARLSCPARSPTLLSTHCRAGWL